MSKNSLYIGESWQRDVISMQTLVVKDIDLYVALPL